MRIYLNKNELLALMHWKEIPETLKTKINVPVFYYLFLFNNENFKNPQILIEKVGNEKYNTLY